MRYHVITIFPELFDRFVEVSLLGKACKAGTIAVSISDLRLFADPPHRKVDDAPYGGGAGMVMKPEPLLRAIEAARSSMPSARTILLSPSGLPFQQADARRLSSQKELILICGRYEGVDQRVIDLAIDEEISVGDAVVMGGEVPAMMVIEATARLIPSVVGNEASLMSESFSQTEGELLLEAPQYTRPEEFRGQRVPPILLSGDHAAISAWRDERSRELTALRRPAFLSARRGEPHR